MFPEHGCSSPVVSKDSEQSRFSLELNGIHLFMHRSCIFHLSSEILAGCFCPLAITEHSRETISVAGYLVLWVYSKCYEWSYGRSTVSFSGFSTLITEGCTSCSPNSE